MPITGSQQIELMKRESSVAIITLATISHPTQNTEFVCDRPPGQDVVSRGTTFTATWLHIDLGTDSEEAPRLEFQIPNIDREIGRALQRVQGEPYRVTVECVLENDLDNPFVIFPLFDLVDANGDSVLVTGELRQVRLQAEPWGRRVVPRFHYALFR